MNDLERRIASLERCNRRWRYAAWTVGALLLIVSAVAAKAPEKVPEVLQAKRIEVLAPDGRRAIVLQGDRNGSSLLLTGRGEHRQRAISLTADQEGTRLMLMRDKESPLISLLTADAGATLALYDGRSSSQRPRSIVMRSLQSTDRYRGGASLIVSRGQRDSDIEAMLAVREPDNKVALRLGDTTAADVSLQIDAQEGKLAFQDSSDRSEALQ